MKKFICTALTLAMVVGSLAGCGSSSQKSLKYQYDDINEYEKWLCGV